MRLKTPVLFIAVALLGMVACKNKTGAKAKPAVIYKGLYSFGPEIKSFQECKSGHEFWVTDSSAELELKYSQLGFVQPDQAAYIEVEGHKIKSTKDALGSDYDSVLVVKKLIKITKDLPKNGCN
jgi:copper homeostasis protein (lipoprotein)